MLAQSIGGGILHPGWTGAGADVTNPKMTDPHLALFETATPETRERLEAIRAQAETHVPDAERCIAYQMPALRKGRVFFYFAAFKKHIGIYPPVTEPAALVEELAPYRGPKGNLIFPLNQPLPLELIGRVAEALAAQYAK